MYERKFKSMETKSTTILRQVETSGLACTMKSGSLPVLATPQLVAWMEEAACACLELSEGFSSVGIDIQVQHLAPSPLGAEIEITAAISRQEKRMVYYDLQAFMDGACIGKGSHVRCIIDVSRFMAKVQGK